MNSKEYMLLLLRCLRGIGIGGESGGGMTMVVEHSPPGCLVAPGP
ncbi:hypothetical protein ACL2XO_11940 [Sodalis sp. RH15]